MQPMQFWKNKSVLITGAGGFIGSWLARALTRLGASVTALLRDDHPDGKLFPTVVSGNLEDVTFLERVLNEAEIDTVFHLGAQTLIEAAVRSPFQTFESNIRGTYNLLEACRRHSATVKRIVVASSDKAYGESSILPYTEEMPLRGKTPYDVSKSCSDLIAQSYFATYRLPIAIARCGNVYGGGDMHWSRLIPGTIRKLLQGERPVIRSNGKLTRDYLYVEDAVEAYLLMASMLDHRDVAGQAFNFGPEEPFTVLEVVKEIQSLLNCSHFEPIILNAASHEISHQFLDSSKARKALGWSSRYSLGEGLKATIPWYANFFAERKSAV